MNAQTTLQSSAVLSGIGLHSGTPSRVRIKPAEAGTGIIFACGPVRIPALLEYVTATERGVSLSKDGVRLMTVEHCLSALKGLGVDNALIEAEGEELPALDGSAAGWTEAILCAGIKEIPGSRRKVWAWESPAPLELRSGISKYKVAASPQLSISVRLQYPGTLIAGQSAEFRGNGTYGKEIARARTFCLEEEVAALKAAGLAKGGSLANAVVVGKSEIFTENGLRYDNECARHKILDLFGDLSLLGPGEFHFHIEAEAPGHAANMTLIKELRQKIKAR